MVRSSTADTKVAGSNLVGALLETIILFAKEAITSKVLELERCG